MTTIPFAAWAQSPADTVADRIAHALWASPLADLDAEIDDFKARVERARPAAEAAAAAAVKVTPRSAALPAAALPRDMCRTHTLTAPRAVSVSPVGDATGDLLAVWPAGTRVTIHERPHGADPGWATIEWPAGTTGTRLPDDGAAQSRLDREAALLARAQAHRAWVAAARGAQTQAETALLADLWALPGGLCDPQVAEVCLRYGVAWPATYPAAA